MKRIISYGSRKIALEFVRRKRRTIAITVRPDKKVDVFMPEYADIARVLKKVSAKAKWIARKLEYFEKNARHTTPREYVSGETHSYLGKKFRLRVRDSMHERVKKSGGFIYLYASKNRGVVYKKEMLYGWYKWQAEKKFASVLGERVKRLARYNIALPRFYVKSMKTRWGSCSPKKGRINLNIELIKAPKECIEYIIDHELMHFVHRNHDKRYYEMLTAVTPDWKERKEKLEKYVLA